MENGVFCIAHMIREQDSATETLVKVQDTLERHCISARRPKLGYHITAISPFRTTEKGARLVAWAFDYWDSVMLSAVPEREAHFGAFGIKFDFFRNPDEDAFVIRLHMDPVLSRAIERGRKKISEIAEWVYVPENYDFNPHVTIAKGKGIFSPISDLINHGTIQQRTAQNLIVRLEPPKVLRRHEPSGRWEPIG